MEFPQQARQMETRVAAAAVCVVRMLRVIAGQAELRFDPPGTAA